MKEFVLILVGALLGMLMGFAIGNMDTIDKEKHEKMVSGLNDEVHFCLDYIEALKNTPQDQWEGNKGLEILEAKIPNKQ